METRVAILPHCTESEKGKLCSGLKNDIKLIFYESEEELIESKELDQINVVFGEPDINLISQMKQLKWIQMTWAGANKYTCEKDFPSNLKLTSASGAFGKVISEYVISGILALYRNLFFYKAQMKDGGWSWIEQEETLEGKRILIVGTGNIGQETARKLKSFDTYVIGISRTHKASLPNFDELYTIECIDDQLKDADVIVISLPGTEKTRGMFNQERLKIIKKSAIIVNVGRGFVLDTNALTEQLQNGEIGGAVLDVVDPEPLPQNHPLRFMNQVILTPHISGVSWGTNQYTRSRILDIFTENLKLYTQRRELKNIIDMEKGY